MKKVYACNIYIYPPDDGCEIDVDSGEKDNTELENFHIYLLFADTIQEKKYT